MRVKVVWLCGLLAACSQRRGDGARGRGSLRGAAGRHRLDRRRRRLHLDDRGRARRADRRRLPAHYPGATLPSADGTGPALDDDRINLMQWTLEQQKIDAAVAQEQLDAARSQLVVVQPGNLPNRVDGVNVALYAQQSTNAARPAGLRPRRRRPRRRRRQLRPLPQPRRRPARLPRRRRPAERPPTASTPTATASPAPSTPAPTARSTEREGAASAGSRPPAPRAPRAA